MQLYFVRHGESEANVQQILANRGLTHPLTEKGRAQAETLAARLGSVGITHIYCSPLLRAQETGQILSRAWGVPVTLTDALREFDCGIWEGRGDLEARQGWDAIWHAWHQQHDHDYKAEDGESFNDLTARFGPFIDGLIAQFGSTDARLALIGHGGLYMSVLPTVLHNVPAEFALSHAPGNTAFVLAELRSGALICTEWCDIPLSPDGNHPNKQENN